MSTAGKERFSIVVTPIILRAEGRDAKVIWIIIRSVHICGATSHHHNFIVCIKRQHLSGLVTYLSHLPAFPVSNTH